MSETLSVLITDPVYWGNLWGRKWLLKPRSAARRIYRTWKHGAIKRGPAVLHDNLLQGLLEIGQPVVSNPSRRQLSGSVGVLGNFDALRAVIAKKEAGRVSEIMAGPVLAVTPESGGGLLHHPAIDKILVGSDWQGQMFASIAPSLAPKIVPWAVGVDTEKWSPLQPMAERPLDFVIYNKATEPRYAHLAADISAELTRRDLRHEIIQYGSYADEEYQALLKSTKAIVYLSKSEAQGISLLEMWACDVPTLVWDRGFWQEPLGKHRFQGSSSAPYLTDACGLRFNAADTFSVALDQFLANQSHYSPRAYVCQQFSLRVTAQNYIDLFTAL